jgi:hypothetical protein
MPMIFLNNTTGIHMTGLKIQVSEEKAIQKTNNK